MTFFLSGLISDIDAQDSMVWYPVHMQNPTCLISACLVGEKCRYDGRAKTLSCLKELEEVYTLVPVCPEELGGLPTPRTSSEIVGDRVMTKDGRDVTEAFQRGAQTSLGISKEYGCKVAILMDRSPSCGPCGIYGGTFTGTLVDGEIVLARLLREQGFEIRCASSVSSSPDPR